MEFARFNKRVFSYLVDFVFAFGLGAAFGCLLFIFTSIPWYFSLLITFLFCYIAYLLINVPIMHFSSGRSIGAFIFGIRTVNQNNEPISLHNIWIKNLYLGLIPFVLANAIYMIIVHTEQTLFDRITDTIVVDIKNNSK